MSRTGQLQQVLAALRREYPGTEVPEFRHPFEIVLYENVAYLVPDERRAAVWSEFVERIGTRPEDVLDADRDLLLEVIRPGGMHPERRAQKLRESCAIVLSEHDGELDSVLRAEPRERRKALGKFPGFGKPGVDKILMLTKSEKLLALDSNGLRVLLRLGFGNEGKSYDAAYRSVQEAIADELPARGDQLIRAHFLLRRHGKDVCKNNRPLCDACCLRAGCPSSRV